MYVDGPGRALSTRAWVAHAMNVHVRKHLKDAEAEIRAAERALTPGNEAAAAHLRRARDAIEAAAKADIVFKS